MHVPRLLVASALWVACYQPDFTGLPCARSDECGPLTCHEGICADMPADETGAGSSGAPSDTGSSDESSSTGEPPVDSGKCCEAMDILFVLDNSESMEAECFEESFGVAMVAISTELYNGIAGNIASFHFGFTTASIVPENPPGCRDLGALMRGKSALSCLGKTDGLPFLSEAQSTPGTLIDAAYCLLSAGTVSARPESVGSGPDPQNDARPIQAMLAALDPDMNAAGGCNEGFSRKGVPLLTLLFTNRDQPQQYTDGGEMWKWWQQLQDARGLDAVEVRQRNALAMIVGPDAEPDKSVCDARTPMRLIGYSGLYDDAEHDFVRRLDICALRLAPTDSKVCGAAADLAEIKEFFLDLFSEDLLCDLCRP
jgi:hypothetical protein